MIMRIHKTNTASSDPQILYRHAKCRDCDHVFTYWIGASDDKRGHFPECPECGGRAYGKTNPAEYLPFVNQGAEGTEFEYRHWLAGEAILRVDMRDGPYYLFVDDGYWPHKHASACRERPGSRFGGWSPTTMFQHYGSCRMELVAVDGLPDHRGWNHRS